MSDKTETHEDFAWPSQASPFSAAETPAEDDRSGATGGPERSTSRHSFIPHTRYQSCTRCGLAKNDPVHRVHPELRRASLLSHVEMAAKLVKEYREDEAAIEIRTWLRIYEEDL